MALQVTKSTWKLRGLSLLAAASVFILVSCAVGAALYALGVDGKTAAPIYLAVGFTSAYFTKLNLDQRLGLASSAQADWIANLQNEATHVRRSTSFASRFARILTLSAVLGNGAYFISVYALHYLHPALLEKWLQFTDALLGPLFRVLLGHSPASIDLEVASHHLLATNRVFIAMGGAAVVLLVWANRTTIRQLLSRRAERAVAFQSVRHPPTLFAIAAVTGALSAFFAYLLWSAERSVIGTGSPAALLSAPILTGGVIILFGIFLFGIESIIIYYFSSERGGQRS